MKISKALFDDPRAARNVAETMHEAPRESKAWAAWVLVGMALGASLAGIAYEYKERFESERKMEAAGYRHFPDLNLWYSGNETDQQVRNRYLGADVRMSPTHSANTTEVPR